MRRITVLLADDHVLVRAGLRKLLESIPGIDVVGEASDGLALLAMAGQLNPELVLMDIAMPGLNGLEATSRLATLQPAIRVLILSMHQNEEYVRQALRNGACSRRSGLGRRPVRRPLLRHEPADVRSAACPL